MAQSSMSASWNDEFVNACAALLRAEGEQRPIQFDAVRDRLVVGEAAGPMSFVHLVHARGEWEKAPSVTRTRVLRRRFWSSIHAAPSEKPSSDLLQFVYPQMKDRAWFSVMRRQAELAFGDDESAQDQALLPHAVLNPELAAHLVMELPSSVTEVGADRLKAWKVSFAEAYQRAKENLRAVSPAREWDVDAQGVLVSPYQDGLDATRLVLPELFSGLAVSGDVVAVAPTHERVFVTGADNVNGLLRMAEMVEKSLGGPRGLCAVTFRLVENRWERWLPPQNHPAYAKLFLLGLQTRAAAYARQKEVLEALLDAVGQDMVVADLRAFRAPNGEILTSTAWQRGVEALLPQTDRIDFVSLDDGASLNEAQVWSTTFAIAQKTLGDMMQPIGDFPERWLVKDFPDENQLKQMALEGKLDA